MSALLFRNSLGKGAARVSALACLCAGLVMPQSAQAHLLPKQTATMRIKDNAAYLVVSVPVSALSGVDTDGDGGLDHHELEEGIASIQHQFNAGFHVSDNHVAGTPALTWVLPPEEHHSHDLASDYVVIMHRVNFDETPQEPMIEMDLFGTGEGEQSLQVKASMGERIEHAELSKVSATHTFFQSSWSRIVAALMVYLRQLVSALA